MLKKTFSKWLGGSDAPKPENTVGFPWAELRDLSQLDAQESEQIGRIQILFKHSTRCGISSMMLRRFEATWKEHTTNKQFFLLDLIRFREVSNGVADKYGVPHQSPQVLILKDGVVLISCSHGDIGGIRPEEYA